MTMDVRKFICGYLSKIHISSLKLSHCCTCVYSFLYVVLWRYPHIIRFGILIILCFGIFAYILMVEQLVASLSLVFS